MADTPEVEIRSRRLATRVLLTCLGVEFALVLLDILVGEAPRAPRHLRNLCRMTGESSIANWISSAQTLLVSVVAWLIFWRRGIAGAGRWIRAGWGVVAAFFLFMAIDDGSKLHERMGTLFEIHREHGGGLGCAGPLQDALGSYHWLAVMGPVFVAMGIFMLVFLWRELRTRPLRVTLFLALSCFGVAMGLDFLEGRELGLVGVMQLFHVDHDVARHYMMVLEELIELFGTTLFLVTFLQHLTREEHSVRVRFVDRRNDDQSEAAERTEEAGNGGGDRTA